MNIIPTLKPDQLSVVVTPPGIGLNRLPELLASLAWRGPLRFLDGDGRFDFYPVARALRRLTPDVTAALERIQTRRVFACHEALRLLQETEGLPVPLVAADLLAAFHDEDVPLDERLRLLAACARELSRLAEHAPVLVITRAGDPRLMEVLLEAADQVWELEAPHPAVLQAALF
ncbi:MAG: hypothetical protein AB1345_12625 [Chloroflexota bacterium]